MTFHVSDFLNRTNTNQADTASNISNALNTLKSQAASQYVNTGAKLLQELLAGDTFTGFVSSVKDNAVLLQLADGRTLSATLSENSGIQPGQNVTFLVEENTGSMLSIRALMSDEQKAVLIGKALDEAGLPASDGNIDIVKELLNNNMPVNKELLSEMLKNSLKFPQTSLNTISNLMKLEIPVTQDNIHQFEAYKNYEHSIAGELNSLPDNITGLLSKMTANGQMTDGTGFLKTILAGMYLDYNEHNVQAAQSGKDYVQQVENQQSQQSQQTAPKEQNVQVVSEEQTGGSVSTLGSRAVNTVLDSADITTMSLKLSAIFGKAADSIIEKMQQGTTTVKQLLDEIADLTKMVTQQTGEEIKSMAGLTKEELPNQLKELFESRQFHHLLKQAVDETMKLTPANVADEDGIKKFYRQLRGCVGSIAEAADKTAAGTELTRNVGEMKSNIDFMNDLNKNMTYFQMPVKFSESEGNGELYVFTNKKALKQGTGNLSALLHLDMDHLGPLDIYVKLSGKQVSTNFCLESEDMLDFIYAHIDQLNSRLEALGYSVKFEMKVTDPETDKLDFVEDFLGQDIRPKVSSQFLFDTKA